MQRQQLFEKCMTHDVTHREDHHLFPSFSSFIIIFLKKEVVVYTVVSSAFMCRQVAILTEEAEKLSMRFPTLKNNLK